MDVNTIHYQRIKRYVSGKRFRPWVFPSLLFTVFFALSLFGISGSSVGVYDAYFYPSQQAQSDTLVNRPKIIRSDEWNVNTPFVLSQIHNDFPRFNKDIGNGQDMSLILDVPYKGWSALFKPQNLIFFVAPENFAFAFKWWMLSFLLAVSSYFVFLRLMPKRILLSALLSTALVLTPMVQWWYQTITIAPIYTGLFILLVLLKLNDAKSRKQRILLTGGLAYLFTSFALILYPPFQIPIALAIAGLYLGFLLSKRSNGIKKIFKGSLLPVATAATIALGICLIFYFSRQDAIQAILNTTYPGSRSIHSGGFELVHILLSYLQPLLQSQSLTSHYAIGKLGNQSEASNYVLPLLSVGLISLLVLIKQVRAKKNSWLLGSTLAALGLMLLRIGTPYFDAVFSLAGLSEVPHRRLLLGIGLLSFLLLAIVINSIKKNRISFSEKQIAVIVFIVTFGSVGALAYAYDVIPKFLPWPIPIATLSLFPSVFTYMLLTKRVTLSVSLLVLFSLVSTAYITPLERNLDEYDNTPLSKEIQTIVQNDPEGRWVFSGPGPFLNYVQANGGRSISGVYAYPQLSLWGEIPNQDQDIYNRYAHVTFTLSDEYTAPELTLRQSDNFDVQMTSCDPFLLENQVRYVLTTVELHGRCLALRETTRYNNAPIYIYDLSKH